MFAQASRSGAHRRNANAVIAQINHTLLQCPRQCEVALRQSPEALGRSPLHQRFAWTSIALAVVMVVGGLVAAGMPVAALSPLELARWVGEKIT